METQESAPAKFELLSGSSLAWGVGFSLVTLFGAADFYWHWLDSLALLLPLLSCALLVAIAGQFAVPWLRQLKAGQIIREDGPQDHLKKTGTPTMGGIFVLAIAVPGALIWTGFSADVIAACTLTAAFGLVGWLDDWQILRQKSNKGISPRLKLGLLAIAAIGFCGWLAWAHPEISQLNLPGEYRLDLGLLVFPLAMFVLLGTSNATNLTDGLDGLAGGTGAIAFGGMAILLYDSNPEISIFCAAMAGSFLGFLWHNRNPAKVFMGDTGSLALGGALAAAALIGNSMWGLLIVGLLFVWEAITVILQVSYFKATKKATGEGKRLFRMAPFHHHLELGGWREIQVVGTFYGLGILLVLGAIALKLL